MKCSVFNGEPLSVFDQMNPLVCLNSTVDKSDTTSSSSILPQVKQITPPFNDCSLSCSRLTLGWQCGMMLGHCLAQRWVPLETHGREERRRTPHRLFKNTQITRAALVNTQITRATLETHRSQGLPWQITRATLVTHSSQGLPWKRIDYKGCPGNAEITRAALVNA